MANTIRTNLLKLHNQHRAAHGRSSLKLNRALNKGAQRYANIMASKQWSSAHGHTRPSGISFGRWWSRYYKGTHAACCWGGENLGWYASTTSAIFGPKNGHGGNGNTWTTSTTHHNIIIDSRAKRVGFGMARDRRGRYYWVAHFAD